MNRDEALKILNVASCLTHGMDPHDCAAELRAIVDGAADQPSARDKQKISALRCSVIDPEENPTAAPKCAHARCTGIMEGTRTTYLRCDLCGEVLTDARTADNGSGVTCQHCGEAFIRLDVGTYRHPDNGCDPTRPTSKRTDGA